ncbi:TatD family hydrolase [Helicobacter cynogastricus]|uniref:TatD family hydrolase n=1 Tax=Helicobacter cynogastricus TaxID=329937 RepID=UPI000CF17800|nr:TatD family hydrolase [Helicobacter cynogastricus]
MLEWIDTHCHLDHHLYNADVERVLENAKEAGMLQAIIPGADPKDLPRALSLCSSYEELYFAVGVHPLDCQHFDLAELKRYVQHPQCVGVGECGLDYHRLDSSDEHTKTYQKEIFKAQIELALEYQKPLIVHIREASQDAYDIIKAYPRLRGVLHCFNGDAILLNLSENFYYGIGGVATFKNAKHLQSVLPQIPMDRLLVETDAPYLTPHPFRGTRNEPKHIPLILQKLSELIKVKPIDLAHTINTNATTLFGLMPRAKVS